MEASDEFSVRRREFFPHLDEILRDGIRMVSVHCHDGRAMDAYAAWRYVWNQVRQQYFAKKPPLLVTDPVEWYFGEAVSAALRSMSIHCIEDFDGWTAKELIEKNAQLCYKSIEEIREVLARFDMTLA